MCGAVVAATPRPVAAQSGATLIVVSPEQGSTTGPDVSVTVQLQGNGPESIGFVLTIDSLPASLGDGTSGRPVVPPTVSRNRPANVVVRGVPEGTHLLQAIPAPSGTVTTSHAVTFHVKSRPPPLVFILIGVGGIAVLWFYRRKILEPWADRYERPASEPDDEDE